MINPKKKLFSYLMLTSLTLPLFTSRANSEVIVPANTVITWNNSILNNFIQMPEYPNYTFTEDFDCSSYTTYSNGSSTETAAIWGCIGALSDSVG